MSLLKKELKDFELTQEHKDFICKSFKQALYNNQIEYEKSNYFKLILDDFDSMIIFDLFYHLDSAISEEWPDLNEEDHACLTFNIIHDWLGILNQSYIKAGGSNEKPFNYLGILSHWMQLIQGNNSNASSADGSGRSNDRPELTIVGGGKTIH